MKPKPLRSIYSTVTTIYNLCKVTVQYSRRKHSNKKSLIKRQFGFLMIVNVFFLNFKIISISMPQLFYIVAYKNAIHI